MMKAEVSGRLRGGTGAERLVTAGYTVKDGDLLSPMSIDGSVINRNLEVSKTLSKKKQAVPDVAELP